MRTNNLNNQLKNTEQYSKQSINSIMRALKELRTELNKSGQYNKSNAVKDFSKNFFKEEGKQNISDKAESINKSLSKIGNQEVSDKWINSFKKAINTAENEASKVEKIGDRVVTGLNKAFSLAVIAYGVRKLASGIGNIANEYISLVETNNLFQVSMKAVTDEYGNVDMASSTYYQKALNFQNEMSEKLGANKKELENYQSIYMNMFSGQGISNDISYMLSESLTKAGYDLASLYNKDISTTMENLQSGISGQPEGLRKNFGIDISEGTLNGILDNLGIERSIDQLSYAEKEVARYIAILQQAGNAQGDFARTIDSPSNQLKILSNQFAELKQVAGSFVVNWFGGLITYVNAVIMAVKEVLTYFATLFGYDLDFGGGTLTDTSNTIGDIGTGLSDASGKAKELKKQLMGFDEINNIDKPSSSSGGGSGGASGAGIDSKLLDALKEWDNKMESIQGKAQKLRDSMLEWLGFERDDDGTWKLKEGYTNFEKIKECVTAIGIAMGTWTVAKAVTNVLDKLGILSTTQAYRLTFGLTLALTGIYLAYQGISHLINGDIDLFSILETALGTASGVFGIASILRATKLGKNLSLGQSITIGFGIMLTLEGLVASYKGVKKAISGDATLGDLLALGGGTVATGFGIATIIKQIGLGKALYWKEAITIGLSISFAITGLEGIYTVFKEIEEGTKTLDGSLLEIGVSAGTTTASFAVLGAQIGGLKGAIIGGTIGAVATLGSAIIGTYNSSSKYHEEVESLKKSVSELSDEIKENTKEYENNKKSIEGNLEDRIAELGTYDMLTNELGRYLDSNGKVIAGNEKRVDYILGELSEALGVELSRNGDLITKNGEVITSYSNLQNEISKTISKLKEEAETEALQELYSEAIKQKIKDQNDLNKAIEKETEAYNTLQDVRESGASEWSKDYRDAKDALEEATEAVNILRENVENDTKDIANYSAQLSQNVIDSTNSMSLQMVEQGQVLESQMQNIVKTNWQNWEEIYNQANTTTQELMLAQSTTISTWSPQLQEKWADMAIKSKEQFVQGIKDVDGETASKILSSIEVTEQNKPALVEAWKELATESKDKFNEAFDSLDTDTQNIIIGSITTTENLTPQMKMKWFKLAQSSKEDYEREISKVDKSTKTAIETAIKEINNLSPTEQKTLEDTAKQSVKKYDAHINQIQNKTEEAMNKTTGSINRNQSVQNSMGTLGSNARISFSNNLGDGSSSSTNFLLGFTRVINSGGTAGPVGIFSSVSSLAGKIVAKFNKGLGNASPSKKTKQSALYFMQGFQNQIKKSTPDAIFEISNLANEMSSTFEDGLSISKTLEGLQQEISVPIKDTSIDATSYVNYGAISGNITTQSQVQVNDSIIKGIATAVASAVKDINVNIEAKTEEGVIVKKATEGIKDFVRQTGELPFPVPI